MDKEIRFESNIEMNNTMFFTSCYYTNLMGKCAIIGKLRIQTALCLIHTDFVLIK